MNATVPKLRFQEFNGYWEAKRFDSVAKFSKGKNISKKDISEDGIPCIRYGELYTTYDEKISKVLSKTNLDLDELVFSEENDIVIPTSGETAIDLATASCILDSGVAIGGDTTIIKTEGNGLFFSYYLNSKRKNIASLAQGVSVVHLYSSHLKTMNLNIPKIEEQEKIAFFLSKVDEKIEKLGKKHQLWETYKKGVMQQIFNRKLTFKDENGDSYPNWKEKKLGDIFTERNEKGYENLQLLSVTLKRGVIRRDEIEGKDNSSENKSNYKRVTPNDIPYNSMRMWQGASGVSPYEGIVSPAYTVLIPNVDTCSQYFGYYFKTAEAIYQFKKYSQGLTSDTWNLKYPLLSEIKIKFPLFLEQEKIANFLSELDRKITMILKDLNFHKEFKKGLLQQMFF